MKRDAMLGSIGENNRTIQVLLQMKSAKTQAVQAAMNQKARTKTPLNQRQQDMFIELTGVFAAEGGRLQQSLLDMENTVLINFKEELHTKNDAIFTQSLMRLLDQQHTAIYSLRRMIAHSEKMLCIL